MSMPPCCIRRIALAEVRLTFSIFLRWLCSKLSSIIDLWLYLLNLHESSTLRGAIVLERFSALIQIQCCKALTHRLDTDQDLIEADMRCTLRRVTNISVNKNNTKFIVRVKGLSQHSHFNLCSKQEAHIPINRGELVCLSCTLRESDRWKVTFV